MKKILNVMTLGVILFILVGCRTEKEKNLDDILEEDNYIIVDVRTKEEYDEGHVVDAINIPYDEIDENTKLDKNKTILVYCKSGKRSEIAYNILKDLGFDVYDLGSYDSVTLEKTI